MRDMIDIYNKRLQEAVKRSKSIICEPPLQLIFEVTRHCNLHCNYCCCIASCMQRTKNVEFDINIIYHMEYEISKAQSIIFAGIGEPLQFKQIYKMIKFIREKNSDCMIIIPTNGMIRLTDNEISLLSEYKILLTFSIDSIDPKIQEITRPDSNVLEIIKNIEYITNYKKLNGLIYPDMSILSVVTKNSINHLKDITTFAIDGGCTGHVLSDLYHFDCIENFYNENVVKNKRDVDLLKVEIDKIFNLSNKQRNFYIDGSYIHKKYDSINHIELNQKISNSICLDPWIFSTILIMGTITSCMTEGRIYFNLLNYNNKSIDELLDKLMMYWDEPSSDFYNSIKNQIQTSGNTFMQIWNSEPVLNLRYELQQNKPSEICKNCIKNKNHNTWYNCS